MTTDLSSLIDRIEKSEGASYALEVDIFKAANPAYAEFVSGRGGLVHPNDSTDMRVPADVRIPNYTASIDAAMTLVEPRALWAHGSMEDGPFARICWPRPDGTFTDSYFETNCATVPLSICACALKARNHSHEG